MLAHWSPNVEKNTEARSSDAWTKWTTVSRVRWTCRLPTIRCIMDHHGLLTDFNSLETRRPRQIRLKVAKHRHILSMNCWILLLFNHPILLGNYFFEPSLGFLLIPNCDLLMSTTAALCKPLQMNSIWIQWAATLSLRWVFQLSWSSAQKTVGTPTRVIIVVQIGDLRARRESHKEGDHDPEPKLLYLC